MQRTSTLICLAFLLAAPTTAYAQDVNDCSEATLHAKNDETYVQLKKAGDIAERMRPTSFFFYGEPAKIADISKVLTTNGFVMADASDGGQAIIAATNATMVPEVFDQLTVKVCVTANQSGVAYDGWETIVVKK
jgi:hypothetical protein